MQSKDDPTIAEIRATRHEISEEFGHDPQRLIAHYIQLQQQQMAQRMRAMRDKMPVLDVSIKDLVEEGRYR
jgi:hypothetical protein